MGKTDSNRTHKMVTPRNHHILEAKRMNDFSLRRAELADASSIAEVHVRSWKNTYSGLLPQSLLDQLDIVQREHMWRDIIVAVDWPRSGVLVIQTAGRIVGFVFFGEDRENRDGEDGEIVAIYLLSEFIGRGLGHRMMERSLGILRETGFVRAFLWVLPDNIRARDFYESLGWRETGKFKHESFESVEIVEVQYEFLLK